MSDNPMKKKFFVSLNIVSPVLIEVEAKDAVAAGFNVTCMSLDEIRAAVYESGSAYEETFTVTNIQIDPLDDESLR